jgi:hypothetical protein
MDLLITILAVLFILFGIGLLFAKGVGSFLASAATIIAGIVAYDEKSFLPLALGFAALWVLRLLGLEDRHR